MKQPKPPDFKHRAQQKKKKTNPSTQERKHIRQIIPFLPSFLNSAHRKIWTSPGPQTAFNSPTGSIIHKKRTKWIVSIFAKHFGKEAVTWICRRDGAGRTAPNPKDTGLKKEGEKINPSKTMEQIWRWCENVTVASTWQGTLSHRHSRPSDSPKSLLYTLKRHWFGEKTTHLSFYYYKIITNKNNPHQWLKDPRIEEAVSQAHCYKHKTQSRQIPALSEAGRGTVHTAPYPTDLQLLSSRFEEVPSTAAVPAVPAHLQGLWCLLVLSCQEKKSTGTKKKKKRRNDKR